MIKALAARQLPVSPARQLRLPGRARFKFQVPGSSIHANLKLETRNLELRRRGQTTAEYAIMIGVVIGALVAMQVYVRRGVNARLKDASDSAGDAVIANLTSVTNPTSKEHFQYEPYYASSDYTVGQETKQEQETKTGGVYIKRNAAGSTFSEQTKRTGKQSTEAVP